MTKPIYDITSTKNLDLINLLRILSKIYTKILEICSVSNSQYMWGMRDFYEMIKYISYNWTLLYVLILHYNISLMIIV